MADFENLIATKATGKAQEAPSGPAQSNIAGQMAQQQSNKEIANVQEQGRIEQDQQAGQKEAIKEEGKIQNNAIQMQEHEDSIANMEQVSNLLQKAEFSELELEDRQDALSLESAAHKLMMEDQSYVQQIREVGRRRRLTDKLSFSEEMNEMVFGSEMSMLMDELGWKEGQGKLGRERSDELFNMNIDIAMAIAAADMEQANTAAIGQGLMKAGETAVKAGAFDSSNPDPKTADNTMEDQGETVDTPRTLPSNMA